MKDRGETTEPHFFEAMPFYTLTKRKDIGLVPYHEFLFSTFLK